MAREAPRGTPRQLLSAGYGSRDAMDAFVSVTGGTVSPAEVCDPANIGQVMTAAAAA